MLKSKPKQPEVSQASKKKVSDHTSGYNQGWARGKSKGRADGISACHEALRKAGKTDVIALLPKIPTLAGAQSVEKMESRLAKEKAKMDKLVAAIAAKKKAEQQG